ncbi:MAG: alpha/beta fold hydrolase [Candidatus Baltobacteraceae bacterium]
MTLLFIHGAGFTGACFERQLRAFPGSQAPNMPGHCEPGAPASIEDLALSIAFYAAHNDLSEIVLCGHSMGGAIALHIALEQLLPLKGLVLLGSGARMRVAPAFLEGMKADFAGTAREMSAMFFAEPLPRLVDWAAATMLTVGAAQTRRDFEACNAFDVMERLGEIDLPLLALTGESDRMAPSKYAQTFADRVPGAQSRIIPDAGHFVMVERPEETNEAIATFLSGIV